MRLVHLPPLLYQLIARPSRFFRSLRVDGSNLPARVFMLGSAGLTGAVWTLGKTLRPLSGLWLPTVLEFLLIMVSVLLLIYIEILGVVYFARRRGWRVPWHLAERVAGYSAIAWIPAGAVMWLITHLVLDGYIERWMNAWIGTWKSWQSLALWVLALALGMLWFEFLVWLGVRQVQYANR